MAIYFSMNTDSDTLCSLSTHAIRSNSQSFHHHFLMSSYIITNRKPTVFAVPCKRKAAKNISE